jgi:hypothetical protein
MANPLNIALHDLHAIELPQAGLTAAIDANPYGG